ncbi:cupin domain-containing protein [Mesorhizobium sp. M0814]|uniref:cupin domain-containing protein n=1 Tax=Mesorhizobium sp. M0814 TaxID=2957004 RepID=UPI00333A3C63
MQIIYHGLQPTEEWRLGVLTRSRMQVSTVTEAAALCILNSGSRREVAHVSHNHPVEEVLTVLNGQAELWLDDERETISSGQSVIIPPGSWHGFRDTGSETLHMQAIFAAPSFEASFEGQPEVMIHWAAAKA